MKNIKVGDKVVYDWYTKKHYVLVDTIDDFLTEEGSVITLINGIYSIDGPLREPTPLEYEVGKFKKV